MTAQTWALPIVAVLALAVAVLSALVVRRERAKRHAAEDRADELQQAADELLDGLDQRGLLLIDALPRDVELLDRAQRFGDELDVEVPR